MNPTIKVLNDKEILKIDQASRALIMEVGTHVQDDEALEVFKKAGAFVDFNSKMVRIPDHVINDTLSKCSSCVRLYDRTGGPPLLIGGDRVYFGTVGIATNVLDFETNEYRQVVCGDFIDFIRLGDVLTPPDFILVPATPTDVPSAVVEKVETNLLLTNTKKHFITEAQSGKKSKKKHNNGRGSGREPRGLAKTPLFFHSCMFNKPLTAA